MSGVNWVGVNPLKSLLRERHLHGYATFVAEYSRHARELQLGSEPPGKAQYYRWVGGYNKTLPRDDHCRVLESMFPGWTAHQLFGLAPHQQTQQEPDDLDDDQLLAPFTPGLDPDLLTGLWCTGYILNGDQHHVDLATVTTTQTRLKARNYPPEPRFEGRRTGHQTDISAGIFNRHLMGHWRNHNDSYYFGSLHLVVLPGESMLDGYYTGFLDDTQIVAQPWKWVRIDPGSDIDVSSVVLKEPRELYGILANHTRFDGPLALSDVILNDTAPPAPIA